MKSPFSNVLICFKILPFKLSPRNFISGNIRRSNFQSIQVISEQRRFFTQFQSGFKPLRLSNQPIFNTDNTVVSVNVLVGQSNPNAVSSQDRRGTKVNDVACNPNVLSWTAEVIV